MAALLCGSSSSCLLSNGNHVALSRRTPRDRRCCTWVSRASRRDEEESGQILKAFFVGKAFADALNERVGSAVGELLSDLGRRQAQQQKQVRQFQEEVEERARAAMAAAAAARAPQEAQEEQQQQQVQEEE